MRFVAGVLVVLIALGSSVMAEDKAAARQSFLEGSKYYDLNQYPEALEAFKKAYWNFEDPAILFNIAQCHRALGHANEALAFYRSYLRKSPDASNREDVERTIADLESAKNSQKAASATHSTIQTNGKTTPVLVAPAATTSGSTAPTSESVNHGQKRRAWIWVVVGGGVAVAVALGVGLGVGLTNHEHDPAPTFGATVLQ